MSVDSVVAHAAILRLYSVIPLALLSCGIGLGVDAPRGHVLAASAAMALAVAGGYAFNDLRDQRCDRQNRPRRPLVSGRLSERHVRNLAAALFGGALLFALATRSWRTIAFVALLIVSAWLYSAWIKFVPGLKNVFVGAWCGLLPWSASLDAVGIATALPAVAIVALFILQKELIADVYDLDGDLAAGVSTIPAIVGRRSSVALVALLNAGSWMLVRAADTVPVLAYLPAAGAAVAMVNVLALLAVSCRITPLTLRAFLEMQKLFLIGGCIALFAALIR